MPYLLLALGAAFGLYGLYRFFIAASAKQVGALILTIFTLAVAGGLLLLTLTGRLPAALAILLALWPVAVTIWKKHRAPKPAAGPEGERPMSRAEALAILGLDDSADQEAIQQAYKRLMLKIHPDQQGSEWMAAKLNAARDYLSHKTGDQ